MTDIVERLDVTGSYPEEREAKAEILGLRAEIERLKLYIKDLQINSPAQAALDEIARLERHIKDLRELREFDRPEIVRLQAAYGDMMARYCDANAIVTTQEVEIWQLKAEVKEVTSRSANNEIARIQEIERLKAERDDWYMRALKAEDSIERLERGKVRLSEFIVDQERENSVLRTELEARRAPEPKT